MSASDALVAFLGPSLSAEEARRRFGCSVLPPARQGDVWRALALRPRAIALLDGVFESQPSVWHHELLAALDAGVAVFGGASMGALRAAELQPFGMVGVGQIFRWVRDGVVQDDSEVALLHAGPEHGHRAFTVPLVNVRHAANLARAARVLSAREARSLVEVAATIFYKQREWPQVVTAAAPLWRRGTEEKWRAWAAGGIEDLKKQDALECLEAAAAYVAAAAPRTSPKATVPPAHVRRRRLRDGASAVAGALVSSANILTQLGRAPAATAVAEAGLRRLLLAGWGRSVGLVASPDRLRRAEEGWRRGVGVTKAGWGAFLASSGIDEAEAARLVESLALEAMVLEGASRMGPDGPSWEEGLADEARLRGVWAKAAAKLGKSGRG